MNKNILSLEELSKLIHQYKEEGNEEITLKTNLVLDLIEKLEKQDLKVAMILLQKNKLVLELKSLGKTDEEIKKILNVFQEGE